MGFLGLSFPITGVDGLDEFPKVSEGGRFIVMDHIVFDPFCETIIRLPKERSFAPLDVCCKLSEPNEVFSGLVILLHMESFKFCFGFTYRIVGTEV